MNILLIISSNEGTIASCAYQLYRGLLKEASEHKVHVVCYGKYSKDGFNFGHGTCFKLNFLKKRGVSSIGIHTILLKRIKKKYKIDCSISTQTGASMWNVITGIREYKIGIFHANLKQALGAGLKRYISFYILYKTIFKLLDKKIGVSKKIVNDLKKNIGGHVQLAYNIHDVEYIRNKSLMLLKYKEENNIFCKPVILYVGNTTECNKAPNRLLEAFALFKNLVQDDVQLVFIGNETDYPWSKYKKLAQDLNISESVHFLGSRKNPFSYMKHAKMLVSPSRDEGLPGVVIESLIVGTPCVVTNSTYGNWEIMSCENQYDETLTSLIHTDIGCITPNILKDEEFTIKMLAQGVYETYLRNNLKMNTFNCSRFESSEIIRQIIY